MGQTPDWVAGISIGAINAALIAGNAPARRVARLREFWEGVSSFPFAPPALAGSLHRHRRRARRRQRDQRRRSRCCSASPASSRRAFRRRRSSRRARSAAISYYDTEPLRRRSSGWSISTCSTRARCACRSARSTSRTGNFQLLRHRPSRRTSTRATSWPAARCRRAFRRSRSTASSTGTAASSRTRRCSTCSTSRGGAPRLVFQVDLFAARGEMPTTLAEASEREKDIRYSSRTRLNTTFELRRQATLQAAKRLVAKLPASLRNDPDAKALAALPAEAAVVGRPPHLPQQALREPVEGLRVLARLDARALGRRHGRHPGDARGPALARPRPPSPTASTSSTSRRRRQNADKTVTPTHRFKDTSPS